MRVRLPIMGTRDGTRICQMARLAAHLKTLMQTRLLTWLVIMVVALSVVSAGAVAEFEDRDMASMQMSMSCDHGDSDGPAAPGPGEVDGQDRQPCCADCDMPDCTTSSTGPFPTMLADAAPEAFRLGSGSRWLPVDLTQNSTNHDTPRKPPRV